MKIKTKNGSYSLPAFFPDATHGVIKNIDSQDLKNEKVQGVVVNALHLIIDDAVDTIRKSGGIHNFINFKKPIISDSGGFQAMSLVRRNNNGKITDSGVKFRIEGTNINVDLTPEFCIKTQLELGSDIIMCLDDCTDPTESEKEQKISVDRTIKWAERCKKVYENNVDKYCSSDIKPMIFGIIQGGNEKKLREKCANELIKIGFDGYAFGGWPVYNGKFMSEILKLTADLMPDDKPKYAMGVGMPDDIVSCFRMGYNMFDCVLPTRDARHKRLYVYKEDPQNIDLSKKFHDFIYINKSKYKADLSPISDFCDCHACTNYSKSYLYHLFRAKEMTALRLATIHNLRFYSKLMEIIQE